MKQIKIAALLSYLSVFLTFIVGMIYTPFLIRMLGQSDYGMYSLIIALASYLSVLDLGIGNAIVRYISRNRISGDANLESNLLGQFLRFFIIISIVTIFIGGIVCMYIPEVFSGFTNQEIKIAQIMIVILTFNYAISFPLSIFSAMLQAYEHFIFLKVSAIIRIIAVPLISIIVLYLGGGLITLTVVIAAVNIILLLIAYYYCKNKVNVKIAYKSINKNLRKEILVYASLIFITTIADKIYWQTDQILLGIFKNTSTVAIYAIAIQFVMIFKSLSLAIGGLFLPSISKLVVQDNHDKELNELFLNISRVQFFILSPTFIGFIIFGQEFILLWAGKSYLEAYYIVIILMIPFFFDLIQNIGITILQAKGLNLFRTISLIVCSILNIIISIPIIDYFGSVGTAVVTAVFLGIGNVLMLNFYYHYKVGLNMIVYWKHIFILSIPAVLIGVIFYVAKLILFTDFMPMLQWMVMLVIFISCYVILNYAFIFNKHEKIFIKNIVGLKYRK